jgi:hypothetical protein
MVFEDEWQQLFSLHVTRKGEMAAVLPLQRNAVRMTLNYYLDPSKGGHTVWTYTVSKQTTPGESRIMGQHQRCPHSAFNNPGRAADKTRESIEVRALVIWEDEKN